MREITCSQGDVGERRYALLSVAGEGATGVVHRGVEAKSGRPVAVKVYKPFPAHDPVWERRFLEETHALTRLVDRRTACVLDFGKSAEGPLFLATEWVEGSSLKEVLAAAGRLAPARVATIVAQVCESLTEAHGLGMLHHGLKPSNILLHAGPGGEEVKVRDYLYARLWQQANAAITQPGVLVGDPPYFTPEQARGRRLDQRSDLYALGVIAYEALAGRQPFASRSPIDILSMHVLEPPPPLPGVPSPVAALVLRCLAKDMASRPPDAAALAAEFLRAVGG